MQYIFIVALEFVLAFIGVALLIRYYNHNWMKPALSSSVFSSSGE